MHDHAGGAVPVHEHFVKNTATSPSLNSHYSILFLSLCFFFEFVLDLIVLCVTNRVISNALVLTHFGFLGSDHCTLRPG